MDYAMFCRWCEAESTSQIGWFGQYINAGPDMLHYVERGSGTPLVLVHGFLEWSYTWHHNVDTLAAHARVLAPDLRGYGLSSKNKVLGHSLSDQAEVLRAFLDAKGVERAILCGHSMGGEVVLRFALRWPERVQALILVASSGYLRPQRRTLHELVLRMPGVSEAALRAVMLNRSWVTRALAGAFASPEYVTPAEVDAYLLPARAPGAGGALKRILRDADFGHFAERLRDVQMPALLIWGTDDQVVPLAHGRRLAEELHGRLVTFEGCGHLPYAERPEAFHQVVIPFVTEHA
ncbi:MAG TPA: alpha/beta fold hydrolase [Symbiobacteriaceae bacterium]|jgi:pimeloyl-ACP methyl ester carboxylesterase|nr:alpha/beta fold hydrolase [Symbiobacteriaceae bacterium]